MWDECLLNVERRSQTRIITPILTTEESVIKMRNWTGILITMLILLAVPLWQPAVAQRQLVSTVNFEEALAYYRPRVAVAADGGYAIAWEALRKLDRSESWHLGVQQFTAAGEPVSKPYYITPESLCSLPGVSSDVQNADMIYGENDELIISINQFSRASENTERLDNSIALASFDRQGLRLPVEGHNLCGQGFSEDTRIIPDVHSRFMLAIPSSEQPLKALPLGSGWDRNLGSPQIRLASFLGRKPEVVRYAAGHDMASSGPLAIATWHTCSLVEVEEPDTCDIMVQFYEHGSNGRLISSGNSLRVNRRDSPQTLSYRPSVAINAKGESVVVWIDYRTGEHGDVFGQRFDANGKPVGGNYLISASEGTIEDLDAIRPEVALLDNGESMVVWTDFESDRQRALGRRYGADGTAASAPFLLDAVQSVQTAFPDIASDGKTFTYTWMAEYEGIAYIYANGPSELEIGQNQIPDTIQSLSLKGYPNPFFTTATLEYTLTKAGPVTLVIYDLLGREVKKLIDRHLEPGSYEVSLDGEEFAMGYYVAKLRQNDMHRSHLLIRAQ